MYNPEITALQVQLSKDVNVFLKQFRDHFFTLIIDGKCHDMLEEINTFYQSNNIAHKIDRNLKGLKELNHCG